MNPGVQPAPMIQPDVKIKTVRERTSVPSQLAGIVAVVVPPLGLVAAARIFCFRSLAACLTANPLTDMFVEESGVIVKKPASECGL